MEPLSIVAYFDGSPGHEKQTNGIIRALAGLTATDIKHRKVSVSAASYCKNWATYLLSSLQSVKQEKFSKPAGLIIGTGSHTHIPMLLEKKIRSKQGELARVVTCMSPDTIIRGKFDLCCIPIHDEPPSQENVLVTLGPPNPVVFEKRHNADSGLILVGGEDKKSHIWNSRALTEQIQAIVKKQPFLQWTVSSSPRTPEDTCRALEDMAATTKNFSFYRSANTPAGWVEEQYALHDTVWVTADSISMVYEALSAGCSVGILPVEWLQQDNKFQKSLTILHKKEMTVDFNDWLAGEKMPAASSLEAFNEAERCAGEILRRWWPERLQ